MRVMRQRAMHFNTNHYKKQVARTENKAHTYKS